MINHLFETISVDIFGCHLTFDVSKEFERKIDAEMLKSKIIRERYCEERFVVIAEINAPLQPNVINGVQIGWWSSDPTYKVALLNAGIEKCNYPHISFALGFQVFDLKSDARGLIEDISKLIETLPTKQNINLMSINSGSMTFTTDSDHKMHPKDVELVLKFNEDKLGISYVGMPKKEYEDMFSSNNILVIGVI